MSTQWNALTIKGHSVANVLMPLATLAALVDALAKRRYPTIPPAMLVAGAGFALAGLMIVLFPVSPQLTAAPYTALQTLAQAVLKSRENVGSLLKLEAALILVPLLVVAAADTRQRALRVADAWAIGAVVSAAAAITDMVGATHISQTLQGVSYVASRQAGLTVQPNHLALQSVMVLPLIGTWLSRSRGWRRGASLCIGILLVGIYSSASRSGEALLLVPVVYAFLVSPQVRARLAVAAPALAGVAVLVVLGASGTVGSLAQHARLTSTASGVVASDIQRTQRRTLALDDFNARPGTGVGFTVIDDATDIYLQLLAAGGLLGLASFGVFAGSTANVVLRGLRTRDRVAVGALGCGLTVFLLNGIFQNQITDRYLYVPVGVLLALANARRVDAAAVIRDQANLASMLEAERRQAAKPEPVVTDALPALLDEPKHAGEPVVEQTRFGERVIGALSDRPLQLLTRAWACLLAAFGRGRQTD